MVQHIKNRWAFLVGINRYAESAQFPDLNFCVNDVKSLQFLLQEVGYTVICLHSEMDPFSHRFPTRKFIEAELKFLCKAIDPDDLLLVYFACHGTRQGDGQPRLIAWDTRSSILDDTGLLVSDVKNWIKESKTNRLVMLIDACYIGAAAGTRNLSDPDFIENVYRLAEGFHLIAASTDQQKAWEEKGHGVFSYYILKGLSGAAKIDGTNWVTVNSLKQYTKAKITRWSVEKGCQQMPQGQSEGDLGDLILIDYDNCSTPEISKIFKLEGKNSNERNTADHSLENNNSVSHKSQSPLNLQDQVNRQKFLIWMSRVIFVFLGITGIHRFLPKTPKEMPASSSPTIPTPLSSKENTSIPNSDYAKLEYLLDAGLWKEADQETARLILRFANQEQYFDESSIKKIPCKVLQEIDLLWVENSGGRFGFSIQKQIYLDECNGNPDGIYDEKVWQSFGDRVGWRINNVWLRPDRANFDILAPEGHLPSRLWNVNPGTFFMPSLVCLDLPSSPIG